MSDSDKLVYKSYNWEPEARKAIFSYTLEHKREIFHFTETLKFPNQQNIDIPHNLLNNILNNLSLALGISYYKLYCPKQIILEGMELSKEQAEFWNTVYRKGLGEFFYKNKIDFRSLISFPFEVKNNGIASPAGRGRNDKEKEERSLVGIGGGKDSIVTAELLKSHKKQFSGFVVNSRPIQEEITKLLGVDLIKVNREIDPKLLELNKRPDAYNGHVPISSIYAFIGLLTAFLYDFRYIVVGNEQSANYGNTTYLGENINHQWSKSFEFEMLFSEYMKKYITQSAEYFSLLRSFSEIAIARNFIRYPKYFPVFSSCNRNFKLSGKTDKKWCCECAKCAFTYVIFSAFLPKQDLLNIFGQNLFGKANLISVYKELLGISEIKPFDCVGTPEEVQAAFYLAMLRREYDNDIIMKLFQKEVLPKIENIDEISKEVFSISNKHRIPKEFQEVMRG